MKFCPNFNIQIDDQTEICPNCGYKINQHEKPLSNSVINQNGNSSTKNQEHDVTGHIKNFNGLIIAGWLCTAISLLFVPILFAAGGVICGYLLSQQRKEHGVIMMIAAIACGILGVIIGYAIG